MVARPMHEYAGGLCPVWATAERDHWTLCRISNLFRGPGLRFYCGGTGTVAEPDAAGRPPNLHALGFALHAARDGWNRERAEFTRVDAGGVRDGRGNRSS